MLKLDPALWRRAQTVFDRIVDLPAAERDAALLRDCGEDGDLRAMVADLLRADDQGVPEPQPAAVALGKLVEPDILPGSRIGSFAVERLIGAGGMGRVYLAHRKDGRVEQSVAIKTIRGAYGGRDLLERFARERRILARLNHPNIARFIDAGECPDGSPYVAMEFVPGTPILDYARARRLSLRQRLELFVKIASAVDHAHRQLVVHRDLKPGNVMVDAQGEPKLLDFGIAKPLQQDLELGHLDGQTAPEARYFSLKHAAPEQIDGDADSVSVDIYALGGLLYELLTGHLPLDLSGLSFNEARARIQTQMPVPPSSVLGADVPYARRELQGDLDRIVLHALRKEPQLRYASAGALIDDIQSLLDHRPISLRASHRWYLLARFLRRHRLASAMLLTLATVIISAAVVFRYQRDEAIRESTRAEMVSSMMIDAFRAADPSRNRGEKLSAMDVMRQARLALSRREDLDPATRTKLLLALSGVYGSLGAYQDELELAKQAAETAADPVQKLEADFSVAFAEFDMGGARALRDKLAEMRERPEASSPRWQLKLRKLALDVESQLNLVDIRPMAESVYRDSLAQLGPDDPISQAAVRSYASSLLTYDETREEGAKIIRQLLQEGGSDAVSVERFGILRLAERSAQQLGRNDEALAYSRQVVILAEKLYGKEHSSFVIALNGTATSLLNAGSTHEARAAYSEAVAIAQRVEGNDSVLLATVAYNAALAAMDDPVDVSQALKMSAMSIDVASRAMPAESRRMGFFWLGRSSALLLGQQPEEALAAAQKADSIFALSADDSHSMIAEGQLLAAVAEARMGRVSEAQQRIEALGSRRTLVKPNVAAQKLANAEPLIGEMQ